MSDIKPCSFCGGPGFKYSDSDGLWCCENAWYGRKCAIRAALPATTPHGDIVNILPPLYVMANAPWNILDASGCRVAACFRNDSLAVHVLADELLAAEIVRRFNAALPATPAPKPAATGVEGARAAFYEAARAMMQAKRDEAASADFDNRLGLAVLQTTKAAHCAHYDLLNAEATERAARDGSK